jgi:hypothetical protein
MPPVRNVRVNKYDLTSLHFANLFEKRGLLNKFAKSAKRVGSNERFHIFRTTVSTVVKGRKYKMFMFVSRSKTNSNDIIIEFTDPQ